MTETPQQLVDRLERFTPGEWIKSVNSNLVYAKQDTTWHGDPDWENRTTIQVDVAKNRDANEAASNAALIAAAPDLHRELTAALAREAGLREALRIAEAALSDIGDAEREEGDDLAWCERRASEAIPIVRAALAVKP